MKKNQSRSEVLERIRSRTTLKNTLIVSNEMAFISLITDLGYRKDKMWTDDEDEILGKLIHLAGDHTKHQLEIINKDKAVNENMKMFMFARWISTCYADSYLDEKMRFTDNPEFDSSTALCVLNRENGEWWKTQLKHFNEVVYPNYVKNGSVADTKKFLKDLL